MRRADLLLLLSGVEIAQTRRRRWYHLLPKSPLGDALCYLTNQWAARQRFVEDSRLAIETIAPRTSSGS